MPFCANHRHTLWSILGSLYTSSLKPCSSPSPDLYVSVVRPWIIIEYLFFIMACSSQTFFASLRRVLIHPRLTRVRFTSLSIISASHSFSTRSQSSAVGGQLENLGSGDSLASATSVPIC